MTAGRQGLRERRVKRVGPRASRQEAEALTLVELLDRVLERGVVAQAEVVISVADVPLIYVGAQALVTSVERATRLAQEVREARAMAPPERGG